MKPLQIVLVSVLLAVGASAVTQLVLRPAAAQAGTPSAAGDSLSPGDSGELEALSAAVASLERRIEQFSERPPALAEARRPALDIDAAIAAYLDRHHPQLAGGGVDAPAAAPVEAAGTEELLARLLAPGLDWDEREAIFAQAREAGQLDALVEALSARAESMPDDAEAQVFAGNAYLQQIYTAPDGPQKGMLAARADQYFDRALELDPQHWDARFTKAVSLSFWPPLFGKQAEAIQHFETLVQQQANQPLSDSRAQTYELLGNLYQQTGDAAKAQEIWLTGQQLYPQNEAFAKKLEGASD